jgi:signal peptidase I
MKKLKRSFLHIYKLYRKRSHRLSPSVKEELRRALEATQEHLLAEDIELSARSIAVLEQLSYRYLPKTSWDKVKEYVGSIVFALIIAIVVRQMWFEFYEIPTGSMRPTFKEKDRLVVSKTQFGINIPLTAHHFYFEPDQVKRGGIVVFTGQDMDIQDVNTLYFYLFPGKKQYIKRMIGKPGDTLYFYGGNIYGLDQDHNDISAELQNPSLHLIKHIPFISFEGKPVCAETPYQGVFSPVVFYQMNEPVAKLSLSANHQIQGSMEPSTHVRSYGDLWGFKNYAMARLLSKKDYFTTLQGSDVEALPPAELYLELIHSPSLSTAKLQRDLYGRLRPMIGLSKSYIPLNETHLKILFDQLYTARFIVEQDGSARRYGYKTQPAPQSFLPTLDRVPPGTYEFYYGKAYQVLWQGITKELPPTHPIYHFSKENLYTLFNLGIEFDTRFLPAARYPLLFPSRYAFFKEGALYVMGGQLLQADDPVLKNFLRQERMKEQLALPHAPYLPFVDHGIPSKETILACGITVPKDRYLVLGDNYAMSADSRDFGFVPQSNLRGVPEFIFWPPGKSFGLPNQHVYPFVTLSSIIIWSLAAIIILGYILVQKKRYRLPLNIQ